MRGARARWKIENETFRKSKRFQGEKVRIHFHAFIIETMKDLYRSILDHRQVPLPQ